MDPIFTVDWFTGNIGVWSRILAEFRNTPAKGLEIGSFQGRASRWLLETILTHPEARLACVDTFKGSIEHTPDLVQDLRGLFEHNIAPFRSKVDVYAGSSRSILPTMEPGYDFAYVDGDHRGFAVLEDAVNAFRLLKYGGILIFDDYLWTGGARDIDNPKPAIDAFLSLNRDRIIVLHNDYQIIVRKVAHV